MFFLLSLSIHILNIAVLCCCAVYIKGRAWSRAKSRRNLDYMEVLHALEEKGISIRVASPKLVMEEVCTRRNMFITTASDSGTKSNNIAAYHHCSMIAKHT